jgi:hypothetical protein
MNRPMMIRYADEEDTSIDESFLKVYGAISRYSKPRKRRKGKANKKVRGQNVDIYYL